MNKKIIIVNEIKKQTEKAVLINANGDIWLPKSQTEISNVDGINVIRIPVWLWIQHKTQLSIITTLENIFETTGEIAFEPEN